MDTAVRVDPNGEAPLTGGELTSFRDEGVVLLRGRFHARWVELLRAGIERNLRDPGPYATEHDPGGAEGRFFEDYCNWQRIPEYRAFVMTSPAASLAGQLMSARAVQIFHEHVLIKEPGTAKATPWHHDMPYYCVDGLQTLSLWLALDAVPRHVCPEFVAGSHRWGQLFLPRLFETGLNYDYPDAHYAVVPDIDVERDAHRILSWDLEPGDAIAFHFLTLHGSPGNRGSGRRRGFSTRWLGDDARFALRPGVTSPPYPGIGLDSGDRMREDWFPVVWREDHGLAPWPELIDHDAQALELGPAKQPSAPDLAGRT